MYLPPAIRALVRLAGPRRRVLALAAFTFASLSAGLLAAACAPRGPAPIAYDADACDYCRMTISDRRFGAEIVTNKGRTLTFDSIECLADYVAANEARGIVRSVWVSDYAHPGTLVPAEGARFLRARGPAGSPMGKGLLAVVAEGDVTAMRARTGSEPLGWRDVVAIAAREGHGAGQPTGVAEAASHTPATDAR